MQNAGNKAILVRLIIGAFGLVLSCAAHAEGLTATGNTLPIGANGDTVLTITGSPPDANFAGTLETTGNVGIGTNSPYTRLEVDNPGVGRVAGFFGTASDGDGEISVGNSSAAFNSAVLGYNTIGGYAYFSVYGLGGNRLVMTNTGNVGIGTSTPGSVLQVNGTAFLGQWDTVFSAGAPIYLAGRDGNGWSVSVSPSATAALLLGERGGIPAIGAAGSTNGPTNLAILPDGGDIGIGMQPNPPHTLSVNGDITATTLWTNTVNVWYGQNPDGPLVDVRNTSNSCIIWLGYQSYWMYESGCANGYASDARLKKDIAPLQSALSTVDKLTPISFHWKEEGANGKLKNLQFGLIAQDVQKVIPEIVSSVDHTHDPVSPDQKDKPASLERQLGTTYMVDYQSLIPFALAAIKELKSLIGNDHDTLEKLKADNDNLRAANNDEMAEIRALKGRLDKLESSHP